ncbi:MAG: hypothetical protein ABJO02_10195 [Reichenbachiella sp.]|uniref:hypothetical protein n=1 Tax=Reichenbachiella sp. TaxID=2184521 RepID=UPI003298966A
MLLNLNLNPKKVFLLDACGAVVSAVLLGLVLTALEPLIGMPTLILQKLAITACFFAAYSFFCFWRLPENWRPFLKVIAMANFCYCLYTIFLVISLYQVLTPLGIAYFIGELIVIFVLVAFEWKRSTHVD